MYPRIDPCPNPRKPLSRPALRDGVDCAGALRAPRSLSCTFFFIQLQPSPGVLPKRHPVEICPHKPYTAALAAGRGWGLSYSKNHHAGLHRGRQGALSLRPFFVF